MIVADPPFLIQEVLSDNERLATEILRSQGGVMEGAEFERLCLSGGMTRPTFWKIASSSAIVLRYAPGVYGLVGAHIDPGVTESLSPRTRKGRVLVDYGWLPERQIWLGYRLSQGMIRNGVFTVPSAMKRALEGEYPVATADGARIGTLTIRENGGWGLGPFYTRRGGEPGDYLVVRFELATRTATVYLGGKDLFEEYRSAAAGLTPETKRARWGYAPPASTPSAG
jgi:hypothetical protein